MEVLPVNSTAGMYLNLIATFSPLIGMKRGVEVGGLEVASTVLIRATCSSPTLTIQCQYSLWIAAGYVGRY
jgi:hypothetical protein